MEVNECIRKQLRLPSNSLLYYSKARFVGHLLRLVFTSDRVVIASVERYDLVKIIPRELEAKH